MSHANRGPDAEQVENTFKTRYLRLLPLPLSLLVSFRFDSLCFFLSLFVLLFASSLHLCSIPPCFRPLQGFINCLQLSICIFSLLQSLSLSIYLLIYFFLSFYPSLYLFQPPSLNLSRSLSFFSLNPFLSFS